MVAKEMVLIFAVASMAILTGDIQCKRSDVDPIEKEARRYIDNLNNEHKKRRNREIIAKWEYQTNITDETAKELEKITMQIAKKMAQDWKKTVKFPWREFKDPFLKRMFKKYTKRGDAALPEDKYKLLHKISHAMMSHFAKAKICSYKYPLKCDLDIEPEIKRIFAESSDPEELKYIWTKWHEIAGGKIRENYTQFVKLKNHAAQLNNYTDISEEWLSKYEQKDFEKRILNLWKELTPLYKHIHAYVRKRLRDRFGPNIVTAKGPIPAHLLGDIWAQKWENLEMHTLPYPQKKALNMTLVMEKQGFTPVKIFQKADEFYRSMNLSAVTDKFWKYSILEKPRNRNMVCLPNAWDFSDEDQDDFRVKQCTTLNFRNFIIAHHEMGHVQYYMQYKDQPTIFQEAANPGFHEAIGETVTLSVASAKHLNRIGLSNRNTQDMESEINFLLKMALNKYVFIPYGYAFDLYRYAIFRGTTSAEDYNCHFWALREQLQGIEPPVDRTEEHFDAGAKYQVAADMDFARYFVSNILQFQFYSKLCELAGEYMSNDTEKKLSNCDIYQSTTAGNSLAKMLRMGSSRPWPDAMEVLTGHRQMKADSILEYFKPLHYWLKKENKRTGEYIGWEPSKKNFCTKEQKAAIKAENPWKPR